MQDPLDTLLHEWAVKPAVDANFRAEVWRRIAERKQRIWFRLWNRTEAMIGEPAGAAVVVAFMLFAGATTGGAWREHRERGERAAGFTAYVFAVDPVAHATSLER